MAEIEVTAFLLSTAELACYFRQIETLFERAKFQKVILTNQASKYSVNTVFSRVTVCASQKVLLVCSNFYGHSHETLHQKRKAQDRNFAE